jgi:hypothetical protein
MKLDLQPLDLEEIPEDKLDLQPLDLQPMGEENYGNEGRAYPARGGQLADQIPGTRPEGPRPTQWQDLSLKDRALGLLEQSIPFRDPQSQAGKMARESTLGAVEQIPTLASGMTAQVEAPVSAGLKKMFGMTDKSYEEQTAADMANRTYQPRTSTGQDYAENTGEFMNRYVMPVAPMVGIASVPKNQRILANARAGYRAGGSKIDNIKAMVDETANAKKAVGEQLDLIPLDEDVGPSLKPAEAGAGPLPEQRAVSRGIRGQQELPLGSPDVLPLYEGTREGVLLEPGDTASTQFRNRQMDEMQAGLDAQRPQPASLPEVLAVDRDGTVGTPEQVNRAPIPGEDPTVVQMAMERQKAAEADAALAERARQMENAEQTPIQPTETQMGLFDDPLTVGPVPDTGLGNIPRVEVLGTADSVPRAAPDGVTIQRTPEGFVAMKDGKQVGKLEVEAGMTPEQAKQINEPASVSIVRVDAGVKGKGVGAALYKAFNEAYEGNIRPSGKTTADAWKVWKRDMPEKVDEFVAQEAQRIAEGAPREQVIGNITDADIAQRVTEKAAIASYEPGSLAWKARGGGQRGFITIPGRKKPAVDQLNKVAGIREALRHVMPDNLTVAEWKTKYANAADIVQNVAQRAANQFTKGGIYMSTRVDNPLYKRAVDTMIAADNRAKAAVEALVHDRENGYASLARKMDRQEASDAWGALMYAQEKKVPLTESMLRSQGFSDNQIRFITNHQDIMAQVFPKINEARASAGLPPISPEIAYVAGRATGDFRKFIYEGDKIVGVIGSNTRNSLNAKVKQFLSKNPDYIAGDEKYFGGSRGKSGSAGGLMDALAFLAQNDPGIQKFVELQKQQLADQAYNFQGAKSHTMQKKGIKGMEGAKPWEDPYTNAKEGMESQVAYLEKVLEWAEKSKAIEELSPLLADDSIKMPNAKKMAQDYIDMSLGKNPTTVGKAIDNLMASVGDQTGWGVSRGREALSVAKQLINGKFLTLDPIFLGLNIVQGFKVMPEMSRFLASKGVDTGIIQGYASMHKAAVAQLKEQMGMKQSSVMQGALDYAKDNHVYSSDLLEPSRSVRKDVFYYAHKLEKPAAAIEQTTRQNVFLSFVDQLHESGLTTKDGLYEGAHRLTDMAMNSYSRQESPRLYQNIGSAGQLPYNLSSYKHNELSRFAMLVREGAKDKAFTPIATNIMGQIAYAGVMGTVLYAEADLAVRLISKALGKPTSITKLLLDNADKKLAGPFNVQDLAYGGGNKAGVDLTGRMGLQATPDSPAALFPGSNVLVDIAESTVDFAKDRSEYNAKKLVRDVAPRAVQGAMDRHWFTKERKDGKEFAMNKNKVTASAELNEADKNWRWVSGTGVNESKQKRLRFENQRIDTHYQDKQKAAVQGMKESFFTNGEIDKQYIDKYVENQGDPKTFKRLIEQMAKEQNIPGPQLDKLRFAASRALTSAYKLQRRVPNENE